MLKFSIPPSLHKTLSQRRENYKDGGYIKMGLLLLKCMRNEQVQAHAEPALQRVSADQQKSYTHLYDNIFAIN